MRVELAMYGSLLRDIHFVVKDQPKLNKSINPNIILHYF